MNRGIAIALGVLAGGLLGAVARPSVVYLFCLRNADVDLSQGIMVFSAGFGFIAGVLAVLFSALLRDAVPSAALGAAVGGLLAYLFAAITFLPLFFAGLLGVSGLEFNQEPWLYGFAVALAGALAGGAGALLQAWLSGPRTNPQKEAL
jgi:MFS family permease